MHLPSEKIFEIEQRLSYHFRNSEYLVLAFVHRSYWNEHQDTVKEHNQRLEFLGDTVLGLVVSDHLYRYLPGVDEGILTDLKARIVDSSSCAAFLQKLGVGEYILLGRGEKLNIGRGRESILADLFEALIGAIYLDGGFEAAKHFFMRNFLQEVSQVLEKPSRNWKAELQELAQQKGYPPPVYSVIEEKGPSHERCFRVAVFIQDKMIGEGEGRSKKEAQQQAALNALPSLEKEPNA